MVLRSRHLRCRGRRRPEAGKPQRSGASTDLTPGVGFASLARLECVQGEVVEMCLAVPMRIKSVDGYEAVCEAKGIERSISLFMLQGEPIAPGDHVLVHVGYAIQKVSEEEARLTWDLFDEILEHA